MTPRFLVESDAAADLDEAFAWYEHRIPGLGSEFTRAVRATFAAIQREPESYARAHAEIRRAHVRRFPYAVYYVMEPSRSRSLRWLIPGVTRGAGSRAAEV